MTPISSARWRTRSSTGAPTATSSSWATASPSGTADWRSRTSPAARSVYNVDNAQQAFDAVRDGSLPGVAALISYGTGPDLRRTIETSPRPKRSGTVGLALVGFGNHVLGRHLPNLRSMKEVELRAIASTTGRIAAAVGGISASPRSQLT